MDELVEREVERTNLEHTDILRWEDDGGQAIEYGHPAYSSEPQVPRRNNHTMILPAKAELA